MAEFDFKALDREGKEVSGAIDAVQEENAFERLRERGLSPLSIRPRQPPVSLRVQGSLGRKEQVRWLRQLATLLSAGVSLLEAVDSLSRSHAHPELARRALNVRKTLRSGGKLSQALEQQFPALPPYVPRLAELGEATGQIGPSLTEAADQLEYDQRIAAELRSAMTYPLFLVVMGSVIVLLMFLFVVPRFASLLEQSHAKVPAISQVVIQTSLWLTANWQIALAGFVAAATGMVILARQKSAFQALSERLPIIGKLMSTRELATWSRTLGGALRHGAELLRALDLAEKGVRSQSVKRGLASTRMAVRAGKTLDEALIEHLPQMDRFVIDLIRTGRTSGKLSQMLLYAAGIYDADIRERTKRLTALAEPIAIVGISLIVGTIVISIVLAMTSLYEVGE